MFIGKGKQLKDPNTGKIYTIILIDNGVILHLRTEDDIIYSVTIASATTGRVEAPMFAAAPSALPAAPR